MSEPLRMVVAGIDADLVLERDPGPTDPGPGVRRTEALPGDAAAGRQRFEVTVDGWVIAVSAEPAARASLRERALRAGGTGAENPLLRSGLALAGANAAPRGAAPPAEAEDGLLTAEDVAGLDLLDTELVVLSACATEPGEVPTGAGVLALRRAFAAAGARALVMSLWKVPDRQTQELMEEFYRRILEGEKRAEALRAAQLAVKAKHPEPFYWSAFICQGNPGPLLRREPDHV